MAPRRIRLTLLGRRACPAALRSGCLSAGNHDVDALARTRNGPDGPAGLILRAYPSALRGVRLVARHGHGVAMTAHGVGRAGGSRGAQPVAHRSRGSARDLLCRGISNDEDRGHDRKRDSGHEAHSTASFESHGGPSSPGHLIRRIPNRRPDSARSGPAWSRRFRWGSSSRGIGTTWLTNPRNVLKQLGLSNPVKGPGRRVHTGPVGLGDRKGRRCRVECFHACRVSYTRVFMKPLGERFFCRSNMSVDPLFGGMLAGRSIPLPIASRHPIVCRDAGYGGRRADPGGRPGRADR